MTNATAILTPMQEIAERAIVVTYTGELQQNDLSEEFKAQVKETLAAINIDLNTDEDFAVANQDIKDCKTLEGRITAIHDEIDKSNKEISDVKQDLLKMVADFAGKRSFLTKKVKTRKEEKRNEILVAGRKELSDAVSISVVSSFFKPDYGAVADSVKGKSKYSVMESCVADVVKNELEKLSALEVVYLTNTAAIDKVLIEHPTLFPDRKSVCLQPIENVALMIEARVNADILARKEQKEREEKAAKEKEEREAKAAAEKLEREAKAKAEAEQKAKEKADADAIELQKLADPTQETKEPEIFEENHIITPPQDLTSEAPFYQESPPSVDWDIEPDPFSEATTETPQKKADVTQVYEIRIKNSTPDDNKAMLQSLDGVFSVQGIKPDQWG